MTPIGHAVDKRPGAGGRRARYDVYARNGDLVRVQLRGWVRPDGTYDPLDGLRTDPLWRSARRFHVHVNPGRRY